MTRALHVTVTSRSRSVPEWLAATLQECLRVATGNRNTAYGYHSCSKE